MSDLATLKEENALLRERITALERIIVLEGSFGVGEPIPRAFNLTRREAQLLGVLLKRPIVTREGVMGVLYGWKEDGVVDKIIDVLLHKLRKKINPFRIEIHTQYGRGWYITPKDKAKVRRCHDADVA